MAHLEDGGVSSKKMECINTDDDVQAKLLQQNSQSNDDMNYDELSDDQVSSSADPNSDGNDASISNSYSSEEQLSSNSNIETLLKRFDDNFDKNIILSNFLNDCIRNTFLIDPNSEISKIDKKNRCIEESSEVKSPFSDFDKIFERCSRLIEQAFSKYENISSRKSPEKKTPFSNSNITKVGNINSFCSFDPKKIDDENLSTRESSEMKTATEIMQTNEENLSVKELSRNKISISNVIDDGNSSNPSVDPKKKNKENLTIGESPEKKIALSIPNTINDVNFTGYLNDRKKTNTKILSIPDSSEKNIACSISTFINEDKLNNPLTNQTKSNNETQIKIKNLANKNQKLYECNFCNQKYKFKGILKRHLRLHTGEAIFQCEYCQKIFYKKIHLIDHIRVHSGDNPYICDICNKTFNGKDNLISHMAVHQMEYRLLCVICLKGYMNRNQLKIHLRNHTEEKPYKCNICETKFKRKKYLNYHINGHTWDDLGYVI